MMDGSNFGQDAAAEGSFRAADTVLYRGTLRPHAVHRVAQAADGRLYVVAALDEVMEAVTLTRADVVVLDMPQFGPETALTIYRLRRRFPELGIIFLFEPRNWVDPNWDVDSFMAFVDRKRFRMPS